MLNVRKKGSYIEYTTNDRCSVLTDVNDSDIKNRLERPPKRWKVYSYLESKVVIREMRDEYLPQISEYKS